MAEVSLSGLNVMILNSFNGNVWVGDGTTKVNVAIFLMRKPTNDNEKH